MFETNGLASRKCLRGKIMRHKSFIAILAVATMAVGLFAGSAMANIYPSSVVGTWNALSNQSDLTITISNQASSGNCRAILGIIDDLTNGGTSNLVGFYCPGTGRFNFVRNDPTSGTTVQDYSGDVSITGSHLYMGGFFAQVVNEGGAGITGEYNFFAEK